jgi:hypothetical protein
MVELSGICEAYVNKYSKEKVKQSHYRPEQDHRVPGGRGSQISRQSALEGGKLSAIRTGRLSPPPPRPRKYSWYSFLLEAESTQGHIATESIMPMTPSGIEPATFRFVVQCPNQLRHRGPQIHTDV